MDIGSEGGPRGRTAAATEEIGHTEWYICRSLKNHIIEAPQAEETIKPSSVPADLAP